MATPGQQQIFEEKIQIRPVIIENREILLREPVRFQSQAGNLNIDFSTALQEVINLCAGQGNPAAGHVNEFISSHGNVHDLTVGSLRDKLVNIFRGVVAENESIALRHDDLVRQNQRLVEIVKGYKEWESNVFWQLSNNKSSLLELESLRIKVNDLGNQNSSYLRDIALLREAMAKQTIEYDRRLLEINSLKGRTISLETDIKIKSENYIGQLRAQGEKINMQNKNIEMKDIQLQDYTVVKAERDNFVHHIHEEQNRQQLKARATIQRGLSPNSNAKRENQLRVFSANKLEESYISGRGRDEFLNVANREKTTSFIADRPQYVQATTLQTPIAVADRSVTYQERSFTTPVVAESISKSNTFQNFDTYGQ